MGMGFSRFEGHTIIDLADLYRSGFATDYPTVQHAPALPEMAMAGDNLMNVQDLPRLWLVGPDTRDLVQIQSDRIVQNWRRIGPFGDGTEYPGYRAIRERFVQSFSLLEGWMRARGPQTVPLTVGELTYVNVLPGIVDGKVRRISETFTWFHSWDPPSKISGFQASWGEPVPELNGIVTVTIGPSQLPDGGQALSLQLAARFPLEGTTSAEALNRFDTMHDHIHVIFHRILTPEAQAAGTT